MPLLTASDKALVTSSVKKMIGSFQTTGIRYVKPSGENLYGNDDLTYVASGDPFSLQILDLPADTLKKMKADVVILIEGDQVLGEGDQVLIETKQYRIVHPFTFDFFGIASHKEIRLVQLR